MRDASGPRRIEITFGRDDVDLAAITVGSMVWKTDDPEIRRRLESSYSRDNVARRVPLTLTARIDPDQRLRAILCDDAGHEVEAVTEHPLEPAQRHPMSTDLLRDQFGRLGDTPFELTDVRLLAADGPTDSLPFLAPKSVLNDLRRRAVQALMERRSTTSRYVVTEPDALSILRAGMDAAPTTTSSDSSPRLCVLVRTQEQLSAAIERSSGHPSTVATIYRDESGGLGVSHAADGNGGLQIGFATPVICKPGEESRLAKILEQRPDVILVRNLTALAWLRAHAPAILLVGDYSLNVTNELSVSLLAETGPIRLTPSYDLDTAQLAALIQASPGVSFEVIVHGHTPMFHTAHCLFAARLNGGNNCGDCPAPCREHRLSLRDRVGAEHPVLPDGQGRNTVFNGEGRSAPGLIGDLSRLGVRHFRIELLAESAVETREVLNHYVDSLNEGAESGVGCP